MLRFSAGGVSTALTSRQLHHRHGGFGLNRATATALLPHAMLLVLVAGDRRTWSRLAWSARSPPAFSTASVRICAPWVLQPLADGLKLLWKEHHPAKAMAAVPPSAESGADPGDPLLAGVPWPDMLISDVASGVSLDRLSSTSRSALLMSGYASHTSTALVGCGRGPVDQLRDSPCPGVLAVVNDEQLAQPIDIVTSRTRRHPRWIHLAPSPWAS